MASLFRPPESIRRNSKSPKLTLPPIGRNMNTNANNSIEGNVNNGNSESVFLSLNTTHNNDRPMSSISPSMPPSASSSVTLKCGSQQQPLSASSSTSSSTIKTLKRRPAPPPLPPLVLASSSTAKSRSSPNTTDSLSNSIQNLQLTSESSLSDTNKMNGSQSNSNMREMSNCNDNDTIDKNTNKDDDRKSDTGLPFSRKEHNESGESYSSTLISSYEHSSNNNSPLKKNTQITEQTMSGKDVDELEEELWQHPHLKDEIVTLGILGEGAGGSVAKCRLKQGAKIFALKTINTLNTDPEYQKQIFRELQFNKSFESDYIVRYYGMFSDQQNSTIYIAMEYMGGKSLDAVYKNLIERGGRISEKVLGKIAEAVLRGLSYLHERKIIHRDIKPQNILLNEKGQVKLCDFGVSGEAVNSLATTFTGTSFYMAPERIQGQPYSVTCDVWSLGLTLLEVAQGHFPFGRDQMTPNIAPIELLTVILTFTPVLRDEPELNITWSKAFKSFIEYCLKKDTRERPSPRQMIQHPWIQGQMKKKVNMEKFINKCWDNDM